MSTISPGLILVILLVVILVGGGGPWSPGGYGFGYGNWGLGGPIGLILIILVVLLLLGRL